MILLLRSKRKRRALSPAFFRSVRWRLRLGSRGGWHSRSPWGRRAAGAAFEALAHFVAALLELLLELLLLLFQNLRIDRRAVESLAEARGRNREGNLAARL